jgi:hypothetical protein
MGDVSVHKAKKYFSRHTGGKRAPQAIFLGLFASPLVFYLQSY